MSGLGPGSLSGVPGGRSVKLKIVDGHVSVANPLIATGKYNQVRIVEVRNVPDNVSNANVAELYSLTVDLGNARTRNFSELGSKILD